MNSTTGIAATAPSRGLIQGWHRPQRLRLTMLFVIDWGLILFAVAVWQTTHRAVLLPALWFIVGARQHGLAVIMHETVHQRLSPRGNASALLGRLCVWPLFIAWSSFRDNHLGHHKYLNEDRDPDLRFKLDAAPNDWAFPKRFRGLVMLFTKDLVGYGFVSNFRRLARYRTAGRSGPTKELRKDPDPLLPRVLFTIAFVGVWMGVLGWQSFVLLWMVPLFTTLPFLLRFRSVAEHFHVLGASAEERTRTLTASWFEREVLGFGPHLIGYHGAHHRFPGVPCHRLKRLHAELRTDPTYVRSCCTTSSYVFGAYSLVTELARSQERIIPVGKAPGWHRGALE